MKKRNLTPLYRALVVALFIAVQHAAAADLETILTNFTNFIISAFPGLWLAWVAKTGLDFAASRGTADAKEIPWIRILFSGAMMCSPAAIRSLFAV